MESSFGQFVVKQSVPDPYRKDEMNWYSALKLSASGLTPNNANGGMSNRTEQLLWKSGWMEK